MSFLRAKQATDWPELEPMGKRILRKVLWFIPEANPDYRAKMHLVHEWLIEFDDDGRPWREIGIDLNGRPVLAGPDDRNYGFWLDTDMTLKDFSGEQVDAAEFERLWMESGVREPK